MEAVLQRLPNSGGTQEAARGDYPFEFMILTTVTIGVLRIWEFPKLGGTLFWGPYNKDPTI